MTAQRNPFAYPMPITLDTLPDLFAHHTHRFGGWRMEDDGGGGADTGGDDKAADDKGKGYTPPASQADLDRIISERLTRDREKTAQRYADYDAIKTKADEYDKALEAAQTEQEKAVKAAREEGKTEALTAANVRLVNAEARALASEAKFRNPVLAIKGITLEDVKVNDDGSVDAEVIKTRLKELSEAEPYLVDDGKNGKPKPDKSQGKSGGEPTPSLDRGRELYKERHGKKTA